MFEFEAEAKREYSPEKLLNASGVVWTRERAWVTVLAYCLLFLLTCGALGAICLFVYVGYSAYWLAASALLVLAAYGVWRLSKRLCSAKRAMIFRADGGIIAPYGLPGVRRIKQIKGHHRNIVNIQMEERVGGFSVLMYASNGNIFFAASELERWEAHKVTVLLTNALMEMRSNMATVGHDRRRYASEQPSHGAPAYID